MQLPAESALLLVENMLLHVGRRTPAGGISSQPQREDVQAIAKCASPDGKIGDGERYCKVHFVLYGSQLFSVSSPLEIFFLLSSPVPNKTKSFWFAYGTVPLPSQAEP